MPPRWPPQQREDQTSSGVPAAAMIRNLKLVQYTSAIKVSVKKPNSIERCFQRAIEQYETDADVYLTTAHTSKGLE
ncbi:MAG: hypothetical protein ACP5UJ_08125 [Athalassotoga sp.]|uniref:hypothetical protein n=1 Tax=Athalassotoga sp. TaxID=2022597 RepID=UPI003D037A94